MIDSGVKYVGKNDAVEIPRQRLLEIFYTHLQMRVDEANREYEERISNGFEAPAVSNAAIGDATAREFGFTHQLELETKLITEREDDTGF